MLQAMFSGVSGLQAHQTKMNVIGNNISNVNTTGFKAGRVSFQDQLAQTLRSASGPSSNSGGQNAQQVGLGVMLGSVDTFQTQGNLQTTGKTTDLAIQGNGFFMVSTGKSIFYTRDGSFDLDSGGNLVNPSTGQKLLGYSADANGNIDAGAPLDGTASLKIPIGTLTSVKQTTEAKFVGNLDARSALQTTKVDLTGNLDSTATGTTQLPTLPTITVYDNQGNAHTVQATFSNPTGSGTGRQWDVQIKVDGNLAYDSVAGGKAKITYNGTNFEFGGGVTTLNMDNGSGTTHGSQIPGANGAPPFSINLNFNNFTNNAATTSMNGAADGQGGAPPTWSTSTRVFDSLGVGHLLTFKYTRAQIGTGAPTGASAKYTWQAMENGQVIGSDTTPNNSALFFDANGKLLQGNTQSVTVTPTDGSISPFSVKVDNNRLIQLANDADVNVQAQDGYPAGTLQTFAIDASGMITGSFTNGQSRALGQIAMASFQNPSGLEKVGSNMFRESSNSGNIQTGVPNMNGRGKINPGFLEMSNVDLSTEFTNLIITQRGFQANTRIVSVVDDLLQDVINLKR